jgi:hypothetical protein
MEVSIWLGKGGATPYRASSFAFCCVANNLTLDELTSVLAALMRHGCYTQAEIVRAEIVVREIARDAVLDYAEEMAE